MRYKFYKKIALFVILSLFSVYFVSVKAVGGLDNARDTINTNVLGAIATHNIRFTLPVSSLPVQPDDFIFIDLPAFTNPTEPTQITGDYTGTPVVTTIATFVRITGISFNPGATISLYGITANNPPHPDAFDVYLRITDDPDGLNLRNETRVIATKTTGSVVVSAAIEADIGMLRIIGYGSPGMFVSFAAGTTTIGTTVADDNGRFAQIFPGMPETMHTITISGNDIYDRTTPPTVIEVFTRAYELTTVSDIILPPTIEIDNNQIAPGEAIQITGRGTPGYKTIIMTEPPVNSFEVTVDENGDYEYLLSDTIDMELGDHKLYSLVQDLLGTQSLFSNTLFFRVSNGDTDPGEEPVCNVSKGDLNCDTTVNLADFSILVYYWGTNEKSADINNDSIINLADFSIMMFYWQG
ncbi:MAG: hypothetical protein BWY19_00825 [bacterium ADurb.Bin212]|nr:MAG: hypothetical protein BWY19_00825 [bacterium ADurb.Bin212]